MGTNITVKQFKQSGWLRICVLGAIWIVGLITGVLFAMTVSDNCTAIMGGSLSNAPSLLILGAITATPLALCILAIRYDLFSANCIIVAFESFCRGFCGFLVFLTLGTGAWLVRTLLFFSSTVGLIFLWWVLAKSNLCGKSFRLKDYCVVFVLLFSFIIVDHLFVSPFLIHLSIYF